MPDIDGNTFERFVFAVHHADFFDIFQYLPLHLRVQRVKHRPAVKIAAFFAVGKREIGHILFLFLPADIFFVIARVVNGCPVPAGGLHLVVPKHVVVRFFARFDGIKVDIHILEQIAEPQQGHGTGKLQVFFFKALQQNGNPIGRVRGGTAVLLAVFGNKHIERVSRLRFGRELRPVVPVDRVHKQVLPRMMQIGYMPFKPLIECFCALTRAFAARVFILNAE